MKKLAIWTLVSMFAFSTVACSGMSGKSGDKSARVKCPSCGYEFNVETP
jgi:transposase-like protein